MVLLRYSLGAVFIWFGVLKLFSVSPVQEIVQQALPLFLSRSQLFWVALSLLEIFIGVGFFLPRLVKIVSLITIGHLFVASVSVLVTQGFDPRFPVLSLAGEFVVKNIVLMAAGFVLFSQKQQDFDGKKNEAA